MDRYLREPVSVCMAVYNGQKYIKEQIDSILLQLNNDKDELIIVDDFSKDSSLEIIESYTHPSIQLYKNEKNIGYIKTFEKAIYISRNPVVFLSDQDDIWIEGRLDKMYKRVLDTNNLLICSNFKSVDQEAKEEVFRFKSRLRQNNSENYIHNIIKIFKGNIAYFGCAMAFKREFKNYILPFPDYIDAHDLWMAMVANVNKKIIHLEDNTLLHRVHGNNKSFVKRKLHEKLYTRLLFFKMFIEAHKKKNS